MDKLKVLTRGRSAEEQQQHRRQQSCCARDCFGCARCARRVCACVRVHRMLLALTGCFQCCARCVCAHLQNVCTRRNSVQHATDKHDNDRVRCASTEKTFSVAECVDEKEISSHRTHREKIFSPHTRKKF